MMDAHPRAARASSPRPTWRVRADRLAALAIAMGLGAGATLAWSPVRAQAAAAAQAAHAFDLPAGPLAESLARLAAASGARIDVAPALAATQQGARVQGTMTTAEALRAVFAGSGLVAIDGGDGSYRIASASSDGLSGSAVLAPVKVTGAQDRSGTTEGSESYAADRVSFGKGQALIDVPQSVSVMTRQRLDDQNLVTLEQVMEQTTGVTLERYDTVSAGFLSRGLTITNLMVDGSTSVGKGLNADRLDMALYDRVELLRGADALFGNAGEAGGAINLVRKRPTSELQIRGSLSAGSWHTYRGEVDVAGPLNASGSLRGRLVGVYEDKDYFYDVSHADKHLVYGVVDLALAARTSLTLGGHYSREDATYMRYGLPRYSNGDDIGLPRSFFLGTKDDRYLSKNNALFARLDHAWGRDWSLAVEASRLASDNARQDFLWAGAIDPVTRSGLISDWGGALYQYEETQKGFDVVVKGGFDLLGRRQQMIVGANYSEGVGPGTGNRRDTFILIDDIFQFDPEAYITAEPYRKFFSYREEVKQRGVYASLALHLTEPLRLYLGGRLSRYDYDYGLSFYDRATGLPTDSFPTAYQDHRVFTPYVGLVHALGPDWSAYASYAQTYVSQASLLKGPPPGTPLDAIDGRALELGVKGQLLDKRLTASFAVYRIDRTGSGVDDPAYPPSSGSFGSSCCYLASGKVTSRGFDVEVNGNVTPRWQVSGGYTYNDTDDKQTGARYSSITPRHLLKLWSNYRLPAALDRVRVGGGVTAQSGIYQADSVTTYNPQTGQYDGPSVPYRIVEPKRAVFDLFADYRIDDHWQAAVRVANLFDKRYYQTLGTSAYGNWYGEPRSFTLTLRATY